MRRFSGDDGCLVSAIARIAGTVAASLLIALIYYLVEVVWNPSNNFSFEVRDEVVAIDGVSCHENRIEWRIWVEKTWPGDDESCARIIIWQPGQEEQAFSIDKCEKSSFELPTCDGKKVSIAWLYVISGWQKYVHLRVHPGFEVWVDQETARPTHWTKK